MRFGRSKLNLVVAVLLANVLGCLPQNGCFLQPPAPVGPTLTGVLEGNIITLKLDENGQAQSVVMTRTRLLDAAAKLGLYDPDSAALNAEELLECLPLGHEVALTSDLFVVLEAVVQDTQARSITVTLRFNKRDASGQLLTSQTLQIVLSDVGLDEQGNTSVGSVTVVGADKEGHELFREQLGPEVLVAIYEDRAPIAAAEAAPAQANAGEVIVLSAAASVDPDGDALTFSWAQTSGAPVTLSGASLADCTFSAPELAADAVLAFTVTVSDGTLGSTATIEVTIKHTNHAPVAKVGPPLTVEPGDLVTLDASASTDENGDALSFSWAARTESPAVTLSDASIAKPTFTAPRVMADTILEFEVTVSDGAKSSTDIARVVVAGPPSMLKLIPADADMVVASTNLSQSFNQLKTWLQAPEGVQIIPALPEEMLAGLNRPVAVGSRTSDMLSVIVAEWTKAEFIAFLNNGIDQAVVESDAGDGVTCLSGGSDIYIAEPVAGLVVISPTKAGVLASLTTTHSVLEQLDLSWLKAFKTGGMMLYAKTDGPGLIGMLPLPSLGTAADTDARCIVVNPVAGTLTSWERFKPGSASLERLVAYQQRAGSKLVGLLDEPPVLALGGMHDPAVLGMLFGMGNPPPPIAAGLASLRNLHPITAISISELPGGDSGLIGFGETVTVDNADQYITVISGIMSDMDQLSGSGQPAGMISMQPNTTDVPGRVVYLLTLDPDAFPGLQGAALNAVLGSEPLTVRIAKADAQHVVISMGGGAARLVQMLDAVSAEAAPLAAHPLVAGVAAVLPTTNISEFYLSPGQIAKLMYDCGQAVGAGPGTDPGPATSILGVSTARDGNSSRLDIAVPSALIQSLATLGGLGMLFPF